MNLIEKICAAGSDNDIFGGTWVGGYRIQQSPKELAALVEVLTSLAPASGFTALSIGIASGGTDRFICENVPIKTLTVIDNGQHWAFPVWEENKKAMTPTIPNMPIREFITDSHSTLVGVFLSGTENRYDLVAIDGDHSSWGTQMDWEKVRPYLAPGAIVWFHDVNLTALCEKDGKYKAMIGDTDQSGPEILWKELKTKYEVLLETDVFGIGAIRVS